MTKQGFDLDVLRQRRPQRTVWLEGKPHEVNVPSAREILKLKKLSDLDNLEAAEFLFDLVETWCKGLPKRELNAVLDVMSPDELLDFMNYLATGEIPSPDGEDEEGNEEGELGNDQKAAESAD